MTLIYLSLRIVFQARTSQLAVGDRSSDKLEPRSLLALFSSADFPRLLTLDTVSIYVHYHALTCVEWEAVVDQSSVWVFTVCFQSLHICHSYFRADLYGIRVPGSH